ncbi:MAG: TonB-dependent receptor, partial [Deltaproteobacteria bacterium]|nr:TonB-dependent receptor [Deltaproteobacteria bacterium]
NLLHARLSYDFWDDRAQVALWGKNLTDSVYFDNLYNYVQTIGTITRYYQTPRTFGAELSVRF